MPSERVPSRRRRALVSVVAVLAAVLGAVLLGDTRIETAEGSANPLNDPTLMGEDLARALDLQPVPTAGTSGCEYFVEARDGEGYCVESLVTNDEEFIVLAYKLRGEGLTPEQLDVFRLQQRIQALANDSSPEAQTERTELMILLLAYLKDSD